MHLALKDIIYIYIYIYIFWEKKILVIDYNRLELNNLVTSQTTTKKINLGVSKNIW